MVSTKDFKTGMTIELDGELYSIVGYDHVKPGKGGAFLQTELKNIKTGQTINKRFRSGEKVADAFIDTRDYQFLYRKGSDYVFMDKSTYEQLTLSGEQMGESVNYLKENADILVKMYQNNPIGVDLPDTVNLEVVQAPPAVKGNTVSGGSKKVILETDFEVRVPLFINKGDILKVDTRSGDYIERVN